MGLLVVGHLLPPSHNEFFDIPTSSGVQLHPSNDVGNDAKSKRVAQNAERRNWCARIFVLYVDDDVGLLRLSTELYDDRSTVKSCCIAVSGAERSAHHFFQCRRIIHHTLIRPSCLLKTRPWHEGHRHCHVEMKETADGANQW